jgi:hypothetical protein
MRSRVHVWKPSAAGSGSRAERLLEALRTARVRGGRTRRRRRVKVAAPDRHHESELIAAPAEDVGSQS